MCAKPTGFLDYEREDSPKRPVAERLTDFREILLALTDEALVEQAARCMDCGIPFCHAHGCPLGNLVPDFNDMVYRGQWRRALDLLHRTNNFPEITGRICPAPCETSCTLNINQESVTIRQLELAIVEKGWREGWIEPQTPDRSSGKRIAIVGSGPAGLAAAQELARSGHEVTVFERDRLIGGILRYGIPDFKLEKWVLDRRLKQLEEEGVSFETEVEVGTDISINYLRKSCDAILLCGGARTPRDLAVPGRELKGIHVAMELLIQQNRMSKRDNAKAPMPVSAEGKRVVIIGGGDTGADCLGTCLRQGATEVVQFEIMPKPPPMRSPDTPWPEWPRMLRSGSSHEEGGQRRWCVLTQEFIGEEGRVTGLRCAEVTWSTEGGRPAFQVRPGSEFTQDADLVLLAMGFTREGNADVLSRFDVALDEQSRPLLDAAGMTTTPGMFVAGDLASGASLVVHAIAGGRVVARGINEFVRREP